MTKSAPIAVKTADKVVEAQHDGYQLTDKDIKQLALTDEEYKLQTWEGLKAIIEENRLEELKRVPSDLKRYISWSHKTRKEYGTIQAFVLKERLGWTDLTAENPTPFASKADTKILVNDWPYGVALGILHLVVWTKVSIPTIQEPNPEAGDITPESRKLIRDFVQQTFIQHLSAENVLWFKNWASIQSVRSVEHIHVLVRGASDEFLKSVLDLEANGEMKCIGDLEREREEQENARISSDLS
ncbi:hypothetical protein L873DRAFT_1841974 [Choiromyces venosus 120613-1]|uniref:N-acetylglucosamine-induced protein 1 n=1 Tax=Choiromyces venosus 120613-1 TaxID=1336337 RepID=A0A3N4JUS8_9PEZI|nr:hypothetical protein L873DRAFT_1841974 [Choiromyces venosus 120613-1]